MVIYIIILAVLFIAATIGGYRQLIRLDQLNQKRLLNGMLVALVILTLMSIANWIGWLPQYIAARVTMTVYTLASGFFAGYAFQLIKLRRKAGGLQYMYRSFWTDVAPNLIAAALFVFGIYRTGILYGTFFTGIGITSGLSLIGFGLLGWALRVVPEFRAKGILMLDQYITWEKVITWRWLNEETLQLDYYTDNDQISEFKTFIPPEDQLIIERLLGKKLEEYKEQREQYMLNEDIS